MKLKNVSCILLLTAAIFVSSFSVMANDVSDQSVQSQGENILSPIETDELGSLTITLGDTEKELSKEGVKFSIDKVADIENGEYILTEEYQKTDVDLNNIHNANELSIASNELYKSAKEGTIIKTNGSGVAIANDLEAGVYLVYAADIAGYDNITPFIISVPTWNEEEGVMMYDLSVMPKHTPIPEEPDTPQTGYENNVYIYGTIAVILLIMAIIVYIASREKHDED